MDTLFFICVDTDIRIRKLYSFISINAMCLTLQI